MTIYLLMQVVVIAIPCAWAVAFVRAFFRPSKERAQQIHDRLLYVRAQNYLRSTWSSRQNAARQAALGLVLVVVVVATIMIYATTQPAAPIPGRLPGGAVVFWELFATAAVSGIRAHFLKRRIKQEMVDELRARPAVMAGGQISTRLED